MRRLLLIAAASAAALTAAPTRILDTMTDGSAPVNATCTITWPSFRTAGGTSVSAGTRRYAVRSGLVDIALQPTIGGTPTSSPWLAPAYTVTCGGTTEFWQVPASGPATLAAVRQGAPGQPTGGGGASLPVGTGVVKVTGGSPALVVGANDDCVKVNGSSGACGTGSGSILPDVGITVMASGQSTYIGVDTAIVPLYAQGATAPTGSCTTGRDSFVQSSGFPNFYGCVGGAWKPIWAVASSTPGTCAVGELLYHSVDAAIYGCTAANTWTRLTGNSATVVRDCFITANCAATGADNRAALAAGATNGGVGMVRVTLPYRITLASAVMYVLGGGSSAAFVAAVYGTGATPGAKVAGSELRKLDLSAGQTVKIAWGTGNVTVGPGDVWLGFSSESAAAQYFLTSQFVLPSEYQSRVGSSGTCSNAATGTGSGYTLPDTCGTFTAANVWPPFILASSTP